MQKTENYNLNLFESTDPVKHEDINTNTEMIDAAIKGVKDAFPIKQFAFGSYAGSSSNQTINVGFTPKAVLVCMNPPANPVYAVMAFEGKPFYYTTGKAGLAIATNGFTVTGVSDTSNLAVNYANRTYNYLVLA